MRDAKSWLTNENGWLALLVGAGVGGGLLGLFLLGFLGGAIRRLAVLREQADRSYQERQAEHQSHEFLHFEISLGVRSYIDNFCTIISAGDEPSLKALLKTLHFWRR
jgi:hypothetical protein